MKNTYYTPEKGFHKPKSQLKYKLLFLLLFLLSVLLTATLYKIGFPVWVLIVMFIGSLAFMWLIHEFINAPCIDYDSIKEDDQQREILKKEIAKLKQSKPKVTWHRTANGLSECYFCEMPKECRSVQMCKDCEGREGKQ